MKRFYNNTKMSGAFSNALRVVALLCVLFGVSSSAWASTGFYEYDGKSLSIKINGNWYDFKNDAGDFAAIDLGNYLPGKGPELQEFYYRTYLNNDNVCATGGVYVYVNKVNKQWGKTDHQTQEDGKWPHNNNNGDWCQEWSGSVDNTIFSDITTPGKYEIGLYVKAKVGGECNYEITLNNNSRNYKFSYTVVTPIYIYGDAIDNDYDMCEPTSDPDVVRYKLDHYNSWLKISDKPSENIDNFLKKTSYLYHDANCSENERKNAFAAKGAHINKHKTNEGGSIESIEINRDAGYAEPVYFYYNVSTKKYWVEASQKAAYKIVFEDGTQLGCTDLNKGEVCTNSIDLGEGTYRFKIYKNGTEYYFKANSSTITDNLGVSELTEDNQYTTLKVSKYSTCTFKLQEVGSKFYLTVNNTKLEEPVLIGSKVTYSNNNKDALLTAYLQGTLCTEQAIAEYGFVICAGGNGCIPDLSSKHLRPTTTDLFRGDSFTYNASTDNIKDNLIGGVTYGYRAFVTIAGKTYLSRETGYFTLQDDCTQQVAGGNPVTFTIDAALGADYENDCKLTYGSLQTAINKLRDSYNNESKYQYVEHETQGDHNSYNLQQPVIFNVRFYDDTPDDQSKAFCYQGNKKAEVSGGGSDSENSLALIFKDFNRFNGNDYTLTIQGASGTNRPWLHHVILRNSRNIVLDNLAIFSDPTGKVQDDALEFDINTMSWNTIPVGDCKNANIVVKNCMIGSNGFTGLHASGYDGITFENNEFEAIMATTGKVDNAVDWGASAKFMFCKNIKFIRNNFRGAHATLVWFQDSNNALFMNNVFWNTNQYDAQCSAVRLVNQYSKSDTYGNRQVENVAFLYNTFYLENNINTKNYNFLHTSTKDSDGDKYNNIKFQYNNCYSYDDDVPGKYGTPDLTNSVVCPNNYWSVNDDADFSFGDCDGREIVSMEGLICETSATGPASLVIRGGGHLNIGPKLVPSDNFFGTGVKMTEEELTYDRYNANARPETVTDDDLDNYKGWTYGAYQGKEGVEVETIYWVGLSDNWDDRNNWVYFTDNSTSLGKSAQERGVVMQRLSCINKLSKNLKVIIPEKPLVQGSGDFMWPQIPADFDADKRKIANGIPTGEQVTAGLGYGGTLTKFADNIEVEYGAAIRGVENLTNLTNGVVNVHYGSATAHFTAPRDKWILVGNVVKPWKDPKDIAQGTRNIISGDYYITTNLPRVYMHEVILSDNGVATWDNPFGDLNIEVESGKVFAIMVPDQYGKYKVPASYYNKKYVTDGNYFDPTQEIEYGVYPGTREPFTGRFINESGDNPLKFEGLEPGKYYLLNNTYPCNINAKEIKSGKIQFYDATAGSFKSVDAVQTVHLKPQHGFIFQPNDGVTELVITQKMLVDANTRSRSAEYEMPLVSLNLFNANTNVENSNVVIRYDEFLGEGNKSEADVEKAFAPNTLTPELYIIANDGKYSSVDVASTSQVIPLGIKIKYAMNVRFEKVWFRGFDKVILVDKLKGVECDLLETPYTTETLSIGDLEGRFFLYLEEATSEENPEEDTPTEIEDVASDVNSINIFVKEDSNTISIITNGVELETLNISDTAGKTMTYKASGYYENIKLPVPMGVYIVQVIGDTASRTEKVILK